MLAAVGLAGSAGAATYELKFYDTLEADANEVGRAKFSTFNLHWYSPTLAATYSVSLISMILNGNIYETWEPTEFKIVDGVDIIQTEAFIGQPQCTDKGLKAISLSDSLSILYSEGPADLPAHTWVPVLWGDWCHGSGSVGLPEGYKIGRYTIAAVPLPGSAAMVPLSIAALALIRRRKRNH